MSNETIQYIFHIKIKSKCRHVCGLYLTLKQTQREKGSVTMTMIQETPVRRSPHSPMPPTPGSGSSAERGSRSRSSHDKRKRRREKVYDIKGLTRITGEISMSRATTD